VIVDIISINKTITITVTQDQLPNQKPLKLLKIMISISLWKFVDHFLKTTLN